jgi:SNF2 family DNA or RNA helicase
LEERLQERKEAREEESGTSRSSGEEIVLPAFPDESEGRHLMREHRLEFDKVKVLRALLTRLMNNENQSAKVLIFSEYDQSFETDIIPWMEEQDIQFEVLGGNSGAVESKIRRFKNGSTKVLLLNARHFGSGLNLQMTTDLVLYHRMANPLERQVLGRAQRFGRTQALRVHSLLYDELETPSNIYTH